MLRIKLSTSFNVKLLILLLGLDVAQGVWTIILYLINVSSKLCVLVFHYRASQ